MLLYSFTCTQIITIKELLSDSWYALIFEGFTLGASVQNPIRVVYPNSPKGFLTQIKVSGWGSACWFFPFWGDKISADLVGLGFELREIWRPGSESCYFLLQSFPQLSRQYSRMETHWFRILENFIFRRKMTFVYHASLPPPPNLFWVGFFFLQNQLTLKANANILNICPTSATYFKH